MAKAGSGWHNERVRHSNARKFGKAGGRYKLVHGIAIRDRKTNKLLEFKKTDFGRPARSALFYYSMQGDTRNYKFNEEVLKDKDGDGVPDELDCKPNDPNQQDSHRDLAVAWAGGRQNAKGSRMFIEDGVIYSYGYHFPIAFRAKNGTIYFNKDGYSQSTSRHKGYVRRAISGGEKVIEVSTQELKDIIRQDSGVN